MSASSRDSLLDIEKTIERVKYDAKSLALITTVLAQLESARATGVVDKTVGKLTQHLGKVIGEVRADKTLEDAERNATLAKLNDAIKQAEKLVGTVAHKHDLVMQQIRERAAAKQGVSSPKQSDTPSPRMFSVSAASSRVSGSEGNKGEVVKQGNELETVTGNLNGQLKKYAQKLTEFSKDSSIMEGSDRKERRRLAGVVAGKMMDFSDQITRNKIQDWDAVKAVVTEVRDSLETFVKRVAIDKKVKPADLGMVVIPNKKNATAVAIHNDYVGEKGGRTFFNEMLEKIEAHKKMAPGH